jgi:hypothetical protein
MDRLERLQAKAMIQEFGLMVYGGCAGQRADRLIVSYSVGLTDRGLPEIVVSGASQRTAHILLNMVSSILPATIDASTNAILIPAFSNEYTACLRRLPSEDASRYMLTKALDYYGRPVDVMQLVLADKNNRMPWEEGVDPHHVLGQSPMLDWSQPAHVPPEDMQRMPPPPWSEAAQAASTATP